MDIFYCEHLYTSFCCCFYLAALGLKLRHVGSSLGFPDGLDGKESACSVRDLGLIPGSGRSLGI